MGCDIHLWVETKNEEDEWEIWPPTPEHATQGQWGFFVTGGPGTWWSGRNYRLFGTLANVRNGWGFAGHRYGETIEPLTDERGVPEDASEEYLEQVAAWEGDGHSHTWMTLAELLEYDWNQTVYEDVYVENFTHEGGREDGRHSYEVAQEFLDKGWKLPPWVRRKEPKPLEGIPFNYTDEQGRMFQEPRALIESVGLEWGATMLGMVRQAQLEEIDFEDIRLVMFFDN